METLEYLKYRDSLLKRLLNTTDLSILKKVEKAFNNNEEEDFFDDLSKEHQNLLLQSIEESKRGEGIPFEQMLVELR